MVVQAAEAVEQDQPISATAATADAEAGKKRDRPPDRMQALRPASLTPMAVASNSRATSCWRCRAVCQSASSTMRRCGTSVLVHWLSGFGRDTRLPVTGSLTKRCRFQTRTRH